MNEYYKRRKLAQIQQANEINKIDDEDVLIEINNDENNPHYQQEDDAMIKYLNEIDPVE